MRDNPHFETLTQAGVIFSKPPISRFSKLRLRVNLFGELARFLAERFVWLGNTGQWGIPGWAISDEIAIQIFKVAQAYDGQMCVRAGYFARTPFCHARFCGL